MNEIVPFDLNTQLQTISEPAIIDDRLPRIELLTSNSTLCKSGEFPVNTFGKTLGSGKPLNIGKQIVFQYLQAHIEFVDVNDKKCMNYFDEQSEQAKSVKERENEKNSGCFWGYNLLCFNEEFGYFTIFLRGKTARGEYSVVKGHIGEWFSATPTLRHNRDREWYCMCIVAHPDVLVEHTKAGYEKAVDWYMKRTKSIPAQVAPPSSGRDV